MGRVVVSKSGSNRKAQVMAIKYLKLDQKQTVKKNNQAGSEINNGEENGFG